MVNLNTITNNLIKINNDLKNNEEIDDKEYDPECVIEKNIDFTKFTTIEEYLENTIPTEENTMETNEENDSLISNTDKIILSELVICNCPFCGNRQTTNYSSISAKKFCRNKECKFALNSNSKGSMYYVTKYYLLCKQQVISSSYKNVRDIMKTKCLKCGEINEQKFLSFVNQSCRNELCELYLQKIDEETVSFNSTMEGKKNINYIKMYEHTGFKFENPKTEDDIVNFTCPQLHKFDMRFKLFRDWVNSKTQKYPCNVCEHTKKRNMLIEKKIEPKIEKKIEPKIEHKPKKKKKVEIVFEDSDEEIEENYERKESDISEEKSSVEELSEESHDETWALYKDEIFVSSMGKVETRKKDKIKPYTVNDKKECKIAGSSHYIGKMMAIAFKIKNYEKLDSLVYTTYFENDIINLNNLRVLTNSERQSITNHLKKFPNINGEKERLLDTYKKRIQKEGLDTIIKEIENATVPNIALLLNQMGIPCPQTKTRKMVVDMFIEKMKTLV